MASQYKHVLRNGAKVVKVKQYKNTAVAVLAGGIRVSTPRGHK